MTTNHVTTTNTTENQEPISIPSPLVAPNGECEVTNSSSTSETPPQSQPPTITTEQGQIDIPDERLVPNEVPEPMATSESPPATHPEPTTVTTSPGTTSAEPSHVTDVTMEVDIEPGTTTPARTPENVVEALAEVLETGQEGQEEMEVSISCTQEDSRPVSEANQEEMISNSEDKASELQQPTSEETTASSSSVQAAVTPGNLRNE